MEQETEDRQYIDLNDYGNGFGSRDQLNTTLDMEDEEDRTDYVPKPRDHGEIARHRPETGIPKHRSRRSREAQGESEAVVNEESDKSSSKSKKESKRKKKSKKSKKKDSKKGSKVKDTIADIQDDVAPINDSLDEQKTAAKYDSEGIVDVVEKLDDIRVTEGEDQNVATNQLEIELAATRIQNARRSQVARKQVAGLKMGLHHEANLEEENNDHQEELKPDSDNHNQNNAEPIQFEYETPEERRSRLAAERVTARRIQEKKKRLAQVKENKEREKAQEMLKKLRQDKWQQVLKRRSDLDHARLQRILKRSTSPTTIENVDQSTTSNLEVSVSEDQLNGLPRGSGRQAALAVLKSPKIYHLDEVVSRHQHNFAERFVDRTEFVKVQSQNEALKARLRGAELKASNQVSRPHTAQAQGTITASTRSQRPRSAGRLRSSSVPTKSGKQRVVKSRQKQVSLKDKEREFRKQANALQAARQHLIPEYNAMDDKYCTWGKCRKRDGPALMELAYGAPLVKRSIVQAKSSRSKTSRKRVTTTAAPSSKSLSIKSSPIATDNVKVEESVKTDECILRTGKETKKSMSDESMAEESMGEESMAEESMAEESMAEESMAEESMAEESMAEESMAEESMAEESMAEESMAEESMAEESMAEESMAEENMAEESMGEESMAEQSMGEETKPKHPKPKPKQTSTKNTKQSESYSDDDYGSDEYGTFDSQVGGMESNNKSLTSSLDKVVLFKLLGTEQRKATTARMSKQERKIFSKLNEALLDTSAINKSFAYAKDVLEEVWDHLAVPSQYRAEFTKRHLCVENKANFTTTIRFCLHYIAIRARVVQLFLHIHQRNLHISKLEACLKKTKISRSKIKKSETSFRNTILGAEEHAIQRRQKRRKQRHDKVWLRRASGYMAAVSETGYKVMCELTALGKPREHWHEGTVYVTIRQYVDNMEQQTKSLIEDLW